MSKFNNILLTYNESHNNSKNIADQIVSDYSRYYNFSKTSESKLENYELNSIDLIITIGGDGTILRAAHKVSDVKIPILGINTGRVGFMSELESNNFKKDIKSYLDGEARIEMRAMLEASIKDLHTMHALNDITVARGKVLRVIEVSTEINEHLGVDAYLVRRVAKQLAHAAAKQANDPNGSATTEQIFEIKFFFNNRINL